jgi:hypothetical protein
MNRIATLALRSVALFALAVIATISTGCSDSCSNQNPSTCPRVPLPYLMFADGVATVDVSALYVSQSPDLYVFAGVPIPSGLAPSLDGVPPSDALIPTWGVSGAQQAVYVWSPEPIGPHTLVVLQTPVVGEVSVDCQFVDNACESQFPPEVGCPD